MRSGRHLGEDFIHPRAVDVLGGERAGRIVFRHEVPAVVNEVGGRAVFVHLPSTLPTSLSLCNAPHILLSFAR